MTITLKEAYDIAKKSLPGMRVSVRAEIGSIYSDADEAKRKVEWQISARDGAEDGFSGSITETDEIFSVALSKLVAETTRKKAQPVADVEVEGKGREPAPEPGDEKRPDEVPF